MKEIVIIGIIFLTGCSGISTSDRYFIQAKIDLHNNQLTRKYQLMKTQYAESQALMEQFRHQPYIIIEIRSKTDSIFEADSAKYRTYEEFNPQFDTALTIDKYLKWCKENRKDPMKSLDVLVVDSPMN